MDSSQKTESNLDIKKLDSWPRLKLLAENLLNGSYKYGRGQLRKDDVYCVWGVACELYNKHSGQKLEIGKDIFGETTYNGRAYEAPSEVADWFGIDREKSHYSKASQLMSISDRNGFPAVVKSLVESPNDYLAKPNENEDSGRKSKRKTKGNV